MSTLLFTWELGAHLGHLSRDLAIARFCRDQGHKIVMAVANLRSAASFLKNEDFVLVQSPLIAAGMARPNPPISYADMLMHEGYDDAISLEAAMRGWQGLFDLAEPDLLIYNHSPTALIAARSRDLNSLVIGTGFEIPPSTVPLPSFRPWQAIPEEILQHAESQALTQINRVLQTQNQRPLATLASLFYENEVQLSTFAELDAFGPRNDVSYLGPLYALPHATSINWVGDTEKRVFAYLRPGMTSCQTVLESLQDSGAEVICAIPGAPDDWITRYDRLQIIKQPVNLQHLLPDTNLVITYGAGTIATALLAAVPVLVVPQVMEQFLAGLPLEKLRGGLILRDQTSSEKCTEAINALLHQPEFQGRARDFALRHRNFTYESACLKLYDIIQHRLKK